MIKSIASILALVLLCGSSTAEDSIVGSLSPKLKQFLLEHPTASESLSAVFSDAFSGRELQLYYFYTDDHSRPVAVHKYPSNVEVEIIVRENQELCDEYISIFFEILNSKGEKRFRGIVDEARRGLISKDDFVTEIMRQEFEAVREMKKILGELNLTREETEKSNLYQKFIDCPTGFEDYLTYKRLPEIAEERDQEAEYEAAYDSLRKKWLSEQGADGKRD